MNEDQYQVKDEASPRTNFTMVPNMVDDMNLSPQAFRLYIHFRRVAGESRVCYQSGKTLSAICNMSTGMVSQAKKELVDAGLIRSTAKIGPTGNYCEVTVIDIWQRNSEGGVHNMEKGVHIVGNPSPEYETINTKNKIKPETEKKPLTKKDVDQVDQQVRDMVEYSKKAKTKTETLLPEQWHEYGKAFTDATGIMYLPNQQSKWVGAFEQWHNLGVTTADVKIAAAQLNGYTIYSPMSMTNTLNTIVAERKRGSADPYKNIQWIDYVPDDLKG